jgi:hypothetical protein
MTRILRIDTRNENAIVYLVWAARSRLPGFPMIPAPQLAERSWLTMNNSTPPWTREALRSGLQYQELSLSIQRAIQIDSAAALSRLLAGFRELPSWREFKAAHDRLTSAMRSELLGASAARS